MEEKKRISKSILLILLGSIFIVAGLLTIFFLNGNKKNESVKPNETESPIEKITPLMYKVTKDGSDTTIYLLGSVHVANLSNVEFPDYLNEAYKNSSYLAFEYDMIEAEKDPEVMERELNEIKYQDGTTLKDHLSEETYSKLTKFIEEKKYGTIEIYDQFKPYAIAAIITQIMASDASLNPNDGIDMYFLKKAKEEKKTVLEVESELFQSTLLLSFSDRLYEIEILDTIDYYDDGVEELKELYEAWKKGDPNEIAEINALKISDEEKERYSDSDIELMKDYYKKMLTDRNVTMTDTFEEYFANDYDTLFIVGAGHIVGEDGIAALLEARGYTVTQLNK